MDERREGVEDADAHVAALEADGVGDRVAVDGGARDRGVDQAHVDAGQTGLPGDGPLGLQERLALDALDELVQLLLRDGRVRLLALLAVAGGEALHQLARDADDDLRRVDARRAPSASRSAERQFSTTPLMSVTVAACMWPSPCRVRPGARDDALAVLDPEHERLDILGADVQRRGHRGPLAVLAAPDPTQDGHARQPPWTGTARLRRLGTHGVLDGSERVRDARLSVTLALGHLRAPAAPAVDGRHRGRDQTRGGQAPRHEVIADRDPDLRQLVVHHERDDARAQRAVDVLRVGLQFLHRGEWCGEGDERHAADLRGAAAAARPVGAGHPPRHPPGAASRGPGRDPGAPATRTGSASGGLGTGRPPRRVPGSRTGCP